MKQLMNRVLPYIAVLWLSLLSSSVTSETRVSAEPASELLFYPTRSAPAQVIALNKSQIPAEISARLVAMPINVGDKIAKGDILANLDCRQTILTKQLQQAKLAELNNQLAFNKRELQRNIKLARKQTIGEAELDRYKTSVVSTEAQLEAQRAALEIAELNVEYCEIKAPYSGVITKKIANVGELLAIGTPVVELLQTDHLEVSAKIARSDELSFMQARRYVFSSDDKAYPLNKRTLLPFIENNTRSREARFLFTEDASIIGSIGRLVWENPTPHLPAYLLQRRDKQYGIFIADSNVAKFIQIEGAQEGRPVPVSFASASLVIIDGRHGLVDGEQLHIVKKQ
ncbi:efflux RND transporter periplasmic adaptor subunit [Zooshikella ganghwensis]|uniref:Efflux RND transporter periplasmic adaptor subunit n=1 Tax=Zooshikella ganghwensis TaxID=202772 RepID=A0A4P9VRM0_9GAMM|nr:efflux RND transporter periplasmic adaptor subunit [Zooshikella ganghwensis]RDH45277.1 efflux RND transporter periplasmic adaptor subunit [Zooshikella ganghwensis]